MKEMLSVFPENVASKKGKEPLLNRYDPGESAYFSTSKFALLAKPPFASLLETGKNDLNHRVMESLRFARELGNERPVVIGAIPFDVSERPYLKLSTNCEWEQSTIEERNRNRRESEENKELGNDNFIIKPFPVPNDFILGVKDALSRFYKGELEKVVLSRTLEIESTNSFDIKDLLSRLESKNTSGYTFAINLKDDLVDSNCPVKTLIGASPELLISKRGNKIIANPLAGSEPRSSDSEIDNERAKRLLSSQKDRREHALVIQSVAQALEPYCENLNVPKGPELIHTATMWHLSTVIEGELKDGTISSLELALAMHPTPAVCGFPTEKAKVAIDEIEGYDRGLFTGMVGWCNLKGDGDWIVTIRCAQVEESKIKLYAGAGIVAGSCPEKELGETEAKFNTMLQALGVKRDL